MARLVYYSGTMNSGKSTLALQTHHNHSSRGRTGLLYTRSDRAGTATVSSRLGISAPALEADDDTNFYLDVTGRRGAGQPLDYLVCDEVQFYTEAQIVQLARVVDLFDIDVFAFGITTDFRTRLFPATARLLELCDDVVPSPVPALCWCGRRGTHQARLVDGLMVLEGEQVLVGDTTETGPSGAQVTYEVLCRRHHLEGRTGPVGHGQS